MGPAELSRAEARRITLAAQGLAKPRPKKATAKHLLGVVDTLGGVQVDTVNVMARAHLMTLFSRVGPFDEHVLHQLWQPGGGLIEYWMHGTSLMRYDTWPLFAWRMRSDRKRHVVDQAGDAEALKHLQREVDLRGEVTAGELEIRTKPKEPWWDWTITKSRLEYLVQTGTIAPGRKPNFERTYLSLFEALPDDIVAARDAIDTDEARRRSILLAARALGVARQKDLTFYVWMQAAQARPVIGQLVADGELIEVQVEGLKGPWYLHPAAATPRNVSAAALVNPFDPVMWRRDRLVDLFGFDYVLEIFVPEAKRVFGYYVLPFLLGEDFVARVDLKADRKAKALLVQASYAEFGIDLDEVVPALAHELREIARWQGLDDVVVKEKGDLAKRLAVGI
ncbi:MAG TPA: crosslink repair DNA glycosylase YcaQ family protein [Acidimicrobiales bacterium]|nr:crosslink repair DNA glycosylase YcaQ family protein [Acidimicrobiales bacterium]